MQINMELISAFLIGVCIILLFIIFFVGVVFYGVGYDAGLKAGLELSGQKYPKRNRDTILKSDLKNQYQDKFAKER